MDPRMQPGFLGTGASLMSDITLLAYILLIVPAMLVGFVFARRKMFEPYHKLTMTALIIINWVLILYLMATSYSAGVAPSVPADLGNPRVLLPTIHLVTGAIAQLLGTYLVIRMWFENQLPSWLKVRRIKRYMRFTLLMWLVTASLGVVIYFTWYTGTSSAADSPAPVATPEVTPEVTPEAQAAPAVEETPEVEATPEAEALPMIEETPEAEPAPAETPEVEATSEA